MDLDNPIWHALTTRQAHLARGDTAGRTFVGEVSLLGAVASSEGYATLAALLAPGEQVGLFLPAAVAMPGLAVVADIPLLQMVFELPSVAAVDGIVDFVPLAEADVPEMMALAELTRPGPFRMRTRDTGDYFGIREAGALVAMAGERLRIPGRTEISAICTHPDHLGRGYARALSAHVMMRILARGERPFLHVRGDNDRAIEIYARLGFSRRLASRYVILERR